MTWLDEKLEEENNIISEYDEEFKEFHRQIKDFDLQKLLSGIKDSQKSFGLQSYNIREIFALVLYAEDLFKKFSDDPRKLETASIKISKMLDAVKEHKAVLPQLIEESYESFGKQKNNRLARRCAEHLRDYCKIGEHYGLGSQKMLSEAEDFLVKYEDEELRKIIPLREEIKSDTQRLQKYIQRQKIGDLRNELQRLEAKEEHYSEFPQLGDAYHAFSDLYKRGQSIVRKYDRKVAEQQRSIKQAEVMKRDKQLAYELKKQELVLEKEKVIADDREKKRQYLLKKQEMGHKIKVDVEDSKNDFIAISERLRALPVPNDEMYKIKEIMLSGDWDDRLTSLKEKVTSMGYTANQENISYAKEVEKSLEQAIENGTLANLIRGGGIRKQLVADALAALRNYIDNSEAEVIAV